MARYECTRCESTFERDEARCPSCSRKSTVREAELAPPRAPRAPMRLPALRPIVAVAIGGAWLWACVRLAPVMSGGLSDVFMVLIGAAMFVGGVVPLLLWLRQAEAPPRPSSGKWR